MQGLRPGNPFRRRISGFFCPRGLFCLAVLFALRAAGLFRSRAASVAVATWRSARATLSAGSPSLPGSSHTKSQYCTQARDCPRGLFCLTVLFALRAAGLFCSRAASVAVATWRSARAALSAGSPSLPGSSHTKSQYCTQVRDCAPRLRRARPEVPEPKARNSTVRQIT